MKNYDYIEYKWEKPYTCAHKFLVPAIIKIVKKFNLSNGTKILDAGCGGGSLVNTLCDELGFKNVYGFDASKSGIELAKKSFSEIADNFFIHNAYKPELPTNVPQKYDLIISMEVIEHLYSPKAYLSNIALWLKNNGYLILTTPYHGFLKNLATILLNRFDRHFNPLSEGGHIKFFSKRTITILLNQNGFKVIKIYGVGRIPLFWKSIIVVAQKITN